MVKLKCDKEKVHAQINGTPDEIMVDIVCCLMAIENEMKEAGAHAEATALRQIVRKWAEGKYDQSTE